MGKLTREISRVNRICGTFPAFCSFCVDAILRLRSRMGARAGTRCVVMAERNKLAGGIAKRLELDYVGSDRIRSKHQVVLVQVSEYETADRTYRVSLGCRAVGEGRNLKDFLSNRVLGLVDLDTGECVEDIPAYLTALLQEAGGQLPRFWPRPENDPIRTTTIDVKFGVDGFAVGWVFGVHSAFRSALDIECSIDQKSRARVWTQGVPQRYSFEKGDLFHYPFPWGPETRHSIQVKSVKDQEITISVMSVHDQRVKASQDVVTTQNTLADLLKNGLPLNFLAPPATN